MKKFLLLMLVLLVASGVVMAQFKVTSVGGGLKGALLLGPTGATEAVSKGGAGMGIVVGAGAKVRATMGTMPVRWAVNVSYDISQGSGYADFGSGGKTYTITQGIIGIGLGAEYPLKEMKMGSMELWPYVGGELQANMFGEATLDPTVTGFTPNSGTRIGLGLTVGTEYQLKEGLNLDVAVKVGLANLVGKGTDAKSYLYSSSVTANDEGNWMDLGLRVGINYALK